MQDETSESDQAWDPKALIDAHYLGVWRYLRAIGCPPHLADDITQETFVAVLDRPFEQLSAQATASYLRRVAFHLFVTVKRRENRVSVTDELDLLDRDWTRWAGSDASGNEWIDALRECFKRLTPRAQTSLRMRFADKATREQIADELKITEHGVKNLQQRAKAQLRACLDEKFGSSDSK